MEKDGETLNLRHSRFNSTPTPTTRLLPTPPRFALCIRAGLSLFLCSILLHAPGIDSPNNGAFGHSTLIHWFPMGSFGSFLVVYVLGGLTFIPLVLSLIVLHVYLTSPDTSSQQECEKAPDPIRRPVDNDYNLKSGTDQLAEKFLRTHDTDVAAGFFAVCREYVPGGVNGKPPERTTPAGEVIATESPSVYQAMYRSLFDRKQAPSIDPNKSNGRNIKRARNVFFIVLRYVAELVSLSYRRVG